MFSIGYQTQSNCPKQTVNLTALPSKVRILTHPNSKISIAYIQNLEIQNPQITQLWSFYGHYRLEITAKLSQFSPN